MICRVIVHTQRKRLVRHPQSLRPLLERNGDSKAETASFSGFALDPNLSTMLFNQPASDRQTQSGPFLDAARGFTGLAKLFEDDLQILRRHANTGIADGHAQVAVLLRSFNVDLAVPRCEFDGIAQ